MGFVSFSGLGKEAIAVNGRGLASPECRRTAPTGPAMRSVGDGARSEMELGNEPNRGEISVLIGLPAGGKARVVDEPKGDERRLRVECLHLDSGVERIGGGGVDARCSA